MTPENRNKFAKELSQIRNGYRAILVLVLVIIVANASFFGYVQFVVFKDKTGVDISKLTTKQLDTKPILKKDYQVSLSSFYNNTAISQVGYQLDLKKQSISSSSTTNCFTPEPPPHQNGCGFIVRPYASGISQKGSYLLNITINAQMGANDNLAIDIVDTEKNEITNSLGIIKGKSSEYLMRLPNSLKQNEQILVRLWPQKGSTVTVSEVIIDYLDINNLQPITLNFSDKVYDRNINQPLSLYLDSNKNGKYEPDRDVLWNCNDGFAGAQDITISDKKVKLSRNDDCVTKNTPASWDTDGGNNAIGPYYWLIVVQKSPTEVDTYPIQVQKDKFEYDIT